ncbi:MAG: hypothetical protein HY746_03045 [Elusimicrobia bacterium]|nr:hypothetical protein [Elusimicrobiota bacterium]
MKILTLFAVLALSAQCATAQVKEIKSGGPQKSVSAKKDAKAAGAAQASPAAVTPASGASVQEEGPANAPEADSLEDGKVMVDDRASFAEEADKAPAVFDEDAARQMPASYGMIKGVFTDEGKNILVFENADGDMFFVQIFFTKKGVVWKLIDRISRVQD